MPAGALAYLPREVVSIPRKGLEVLVPFAGGQSAGVLYVSIPRKGLEVLVPLSQTPRDTGAAFQSLGRG